MMLRTDNKDGTWWFVLPLSASLASITRNVRVLGTNPILLPWVTRQGKDREDSHVCRLASLVDVGWNPLIWFSLCVKCMRITSMFWCFGTFFSGGRNYFFLLRGTREARRYNTSYARGPPDIRGARNPRLKTLPLALFRGETFQIILFLHMYTKQLHTIISSKMFFLTCDTLHRKQHRDNIDHVR